MKPFETYFGGKSGSGTYQAIINQIPPHRTYVEPFAGNGGIYRNKRAADITILNDVDLAVVDAWVKTGVRECNQMERVDLGVQVFPLDAFMLLHDHKQWLDRKDTFIYVDPPFPHLSRRSDTRYAYELTDMQHGELLRLINSYHHANIAISTYPNSLYEYALDEWRRIEFQSTTRGGMATQWLLMNYEEPAELHDYRYLGEDYRERERITKKVRRHLKKFEALPPLERKALLSALLQL